MRANESRGESPRAHEISSDSSQTIESQSWQFAQFDKVNIHSVFIGLNLVILLKFRQLRRDNLIKILMCEKSLQWTVLLLSWYHLAALISIILVFFNDITELLCLTAFWSTFSFTIKSIKFLRLFKCDLIFPQLLPKYKQLNRPRRKNYFHHKNKQLHGPLEIFK